MPTTVVQAFDKLLHSLELTDRERTDVPQKAKVVVADLHKHFAGVTNDFVGGAFTRGTALRPLLDVSLFLVLDPAGHAGLRGAGPKAWLEKLHIALSLAHPKGEPPRIDGRAVNVRLSRDLGFDVVPAFDEGGGVYRIPDRRQESWLKTAPEAQREASLKAHEKAAAKLHPLIRAAKLWNQLHQKPLAPFHLEVLTGKAVPTPPLNYPDAVRKLFAKSAELLQKGASEPGSVGPDVEEGLSGERRTRAQLALKEALRLVDQAIQFERTFRLDEAHRTWRTIFGEAYPETGKK